MGTKLEPGAFDCYAAAEPDEPMFTLLGRDADAPALVEAWADARERKGEDPKKVAEAYECAEQMRRWRREHRTQAVAIAEVLALCEAALGTDGAHHKQWYIEQIMLASGGTLPSEYAGVERGIAP